MKRKTFIACLVFLSGACLSVAGVSAQDAGQLRQLKKRIIKLQFETQRLSSEIGTLTEKWTSQQEKTSGVIGALALENQRISKKIAAVVRKNEMLEENLESYRAQSATTKVAELEKVVMALLLEAVGEPKKAEPAILELINEGSEELPKDLLILYLAERKKRSGELKESLGYLGALVSDFPESSYLPRSIFEMSELLGRLGKPVEQRTLLQQLSLGDGADKYVKKAKEKLTALPVSKAG